MFNGGVFFNDVLSRQSPVPRVRGVRPMLTGEISTCVVLSLENQYAKIEYSEYWLIIYYSDSK